MAWDVSVGYSVFRVLLVAASLVFCRRLFNRPRATEALLLVLGINLIAWAAYVVPLARPYGVHTNRDRAFNYGNAAIVANGWSPMEQVQVGFTNLEPLWSLVGAALAGFNPANILWSYGALSPLVLLAVGLGLYRGLAEDNSEPDRWERVFIVFSLFGLASISLSGENPLRPLWVAMFLFKPNHAFAWALMGLAVAFHRNWVRLALVLSLLAWVFVIYWAFFLPSLVLATLLLPRAQREWRSLTVGIGLSVVAAVPYILHLMRDFSPASGSSGSSHMWTDPVAGAVRLPHWVTLDLGLLGVLALVGLVDARRLRTVRDAHLVAIVGVAGVFTLIYTVAAYGTGLPSPDEQHYYYRFALSLLAGKGLAMLAQKIETLAAWRAGQGSALALALAIPLSFQAYWDPPGMDDYFKYDRTPITKKTLAYGEFVLKDTPARAIFLGGEEASSWIPILSGRRVLLAGLDLRPRDLAERKRVEREILLSRDSARIRSAAAEYGITHVALDGSLLLTYGEERFLGIASVPAFELVFSNSEIRILRIRD